MGIAAQPSFSFPVLPGSGWHPLRTSAHRRSPSSELALFLTDEGTHSVPPVQIPSGGEAAPREASRLPLGWFARFEAGSTIILGSSGLPAGGRIPPGGYPSPFATAMAGGYARQSSRFPAYRAGDGVLRGVSTKFVGSRFWMFPFQGFPAPPFSLVSLAARVLLRRGLSSSQTRSP